MTAAIEETEFDYNLWVRTQIDAYDAGLLEPWRIEELHRPDWSNESNESDDEDDDLLGNWSRVVHDRATPDQTWDWLNDVLGDDFKCPGHFWDKHSNTYEGLSSLLARTVKSHRTGETIDQTISVAGEPHLKLPGRPWIMHARNPTTSDIHTTTEVRSNE